jgi:phosphatidylglycerol:prolipoprotein diacylglycerol transferase
MSLKITTLMDMIIPNILIAQVCGRWGNFFNREVYGACVDHLYALKNWWMLPNWLVENMRGGFSGGVYVSCSSSQYAQPLFLYEGILNFIGFILITIVLRKYFKKRIDGTLSACYLLWYGVVRLCLEGFRNEKFIMRWGTISQSELTSIAYIVLGVLFIVALYVIKFSKGKQIEFGLTKLTRKHYVYTKKEKAEETKEESLKIKETIVEEKNDSEKLKDENNG